eukprot:sb/3463829/
MFVILIFAVIFGMCIIHRTKKLCKYQFGTFTKQVVAALNVVEDELNAANDTPLILDESDMSKIFDASNVHVPGTYIDILKDLKREHHFTLGEGMLIASMLKEKQETDNYYHLKSPRPSHRKIEKKPVFLGGSCNPTTWRGDIVIPMFQDRHIDFYNPQVDEWTEALVQAEAKAKEQAQLLFFVLDNQTRALASIMEACYFLGTRKPLTLIVKEYDGPGNKWEIQGEELDEYEIDLLNDLKRYVLEIAKLEHIPVFKDTATAAHYVLALYDGRVDFKDHGQNRRMGISALKYIVSQSKHTSDMFDSYCSKSGLIKNTEQLVRVCSQTYRRVDSHPEVEAALQRLRKVKLPLTKDLFMAFYSELYSDISSAALSIRRKRKITRRRRIIVPDWSGNAFIKKKKGEIEAFETLLRESDAPVDVLPFYDVLYESRTEDVHLMIIPEGEHSTLCMMQAAFLLGRGSHVVLYMRDYCADGTRAPPSPTAQKDYRRCRAYLQDMALHHGMDIFDTPEECVRHVKELLASDQS